MGNNYCQLSGSFIKTSVRGVSIRSEEIRENRKKICPINETWFVFPISLITCGTDWTREWKGKEIVENNIITWSSIPSRENFLLCSQSRPEESETRYMRRSLVIVLCVCNEAGKTSLSWIWTLPKCIFFQFGVTMNVSLGWDWLREEVHQPGKWERFDLKLYKRMEMFGKRGNEIHFVILLTRVTVLRLRKRGDSDNVRLMGDGWLTTRKRRVAKSSHQELQKSRHRKSVYNKSGIFIRRGNFCRSSWPFLLLRVSCLSALVSCFYINAPAGCEWEKRMSDCTILWCLGGWWPKRKGSRWHPKVEQCGWWPFCFGFHSVHKRFLGCCGKRWGFRFRWRGKRTPWNKSEVDRKTDEEEEDYMSQESFMSGGQL